MRKKSVLIGGGLGYCYKRWMSSSSSEGTKRFAAVWGNGDYGRLGFGNLDSTWWPKLINSSSFHNSNLKSISCGGAHTLFLTETGRVYATGLNDFGQIGISDSTTYCMVQYQKHFSSSILSPVCLCFNRWMVSFLQSMKDL
ncbi:hypothetical protein OIU85_019324 [Salix viminalis]|uniref:Regulator of chromosome condensation 1/beta-lactamase-inhibitor protein II n=1 Tax=Salix viminalis TaxID=40686 RepID=A0A9Q0ZK01_SALVM|nr:hypothetical protein OIU85_019324 [Salix viminalis]